MIRSPICLLVATLLIGCATTPVTGPPTGSATFDVSIPLTKTQAVMRITDHQKISTREETWTVTEAPSYKGRAVFGISNGVDLQLFDKTTRNWIATLRNGEERSSARPDGGEFLWPLWVGKSWTATFGFYNHEAGRNWSSVQNRWKVTAYEDITVPAGTFKTLRIESSPGINSAAKRTVWYSPEHGLIVKRIYERTNDHYLGYGKITTELVKLENP